LAEGRLADAGLRSVHVLTGGVTGWEARGLELVRAAEGSEAWALERQVRLVAGGIVAAAVAASLVWSPARPLAGAVGTRLVAVAVSDTCAMGAVLARLPYNIRARAACDMPGVVATITGTEEVHP
jgi:hypothetical protein